jgi:hypothetical protein
MATSLTHEDRIRRRILATDQAQHQYKRKIHTLRRIVAGDVSALGGGSDSGDQNQEIARPYTPELGDILITDIEEGRSNQLLQNLRTLVLQTAYTFPDIEFEGIRPEESALNAEYVRQRLGPSPTGCDARHQLRLSLLDYLLGGVGASFAGFEVDRPVLRHIDTLDLTYDQTARVPQDMRWVALRSRQPMWFWVQMFGKNAVQKAYGDYSKDDPAFQDKPIETLWYWDIQGDKGTMQVSFGTPNGLSDTPIMRSINPYYRLINGQRFRMTAAAASLDPASRPMCDQGFGNL